MIQTGIEAVKNMGPNSYVIVLLVVFISERVISMVIKGVVTLRNGKEKTGDTKIMPCLENPLFSHSWENHKIEMHDTRESSKRMEASLSILKRESLLQTSEIKKQTKAIEGSNTLLARIAKNGSKDKD